MRDTIFRETLRSYHEIIEDIEQLSYREEEHISLMRMRMDTIRRRREKPPIYT
jgi:hypothetical protein